MQQEEVKKETIEHAARKIAIIYEPGKTILTPQDQQLLDAYTRLHDFELTMQETASRLFNEFIPVTKKITELNEELLKMQAAFDECTLLADKLSAASYDTKETSLEKLAEHQKQTGEELTNYNDKLINIYNTVTGLSQELDQYNVANEEEINTLYDEYSKINTDHSVNWESNAINIVTFMDEYARFESYRSVNEDRRESLIDFCDTAVSDYSTLTLKSNSLFDVWKEFIKRYELLILSANLHAGTIGFTNN